MTCMVWSSRLVQTCLTCPVTYAIARQLGFTCPWKSAKSMQHVIISQPSVVCKTLQESSRKLYKCLGVLWPCEDQSLHWGTKVIRSLASDGLQLWALVPTAGGAVACEDRCLCIASPGSDIIHWRRSIDEVVVVDCTAVYAFTGCRQSVGEDASELVTQIQSAKRPLPIAKVYLQK